MSLCLNFLGNEWFLHIRFPLETMKPLWPHAGNIVMLDLSSAFPGWLKLQSDLFLRVSRVSADILLNFKTCHRFLHNFLKSLPKDMLIDFKERGRKWETEREISMWERNIDWLPPTCALTRDRTCIPGMHANWGSNPQSLGVQDKAPTNWATLLGLFTIF